MTKPTLDSILRISEVEEIRIAMCHVFQDAQLNLSGHRKLVIVMKNIFRRAIELEYADNFLMYFTKLINKILVLKKGEQVGDRIAKFCSAFVASISQEDDEEKMIKTHEEDYEETYTEAFIKYLILHLLRGIEVKDKTVRYRVVQILAYLVYYIGDIDNDTFEALYTSLNKRLFDKESNVRIQAVVALSRFQYFNFDFDSDSNPFNIPISKEAVIDKITAILKYDDSAEVRRAALLNLNKNSDTIPQVIGRVRDDNSINRRLVFSRICREIEGGVLKLDPKLREYLLKWGLNDRDESVKQAATKMLNKQWFEAVNEDVLEFVEQLQVTENEAADLAISIFFKGRDDKLASIKIDELYWKALTVEKAFLMRAFYYHCNLNNLYDLVDSNFPELVELADTLEKYLQLRTRFLHENEDIVKKHEIHQDQLENLKSQMVVVENSMVKIKNDVELNRRRLAETLKTIEDYQVIQKLIKKRLARLKKDDNTFDDLINEENEQIVEQLVEFSTEELNEKYSEIRESMTECRADVKSLEEVLRKAEAEFKLETEKYHSLLLQKTDEYSSFSQYDDVYLPFADKFKDLEFIIEQLLLVSKEFDFSDEIGRRKMLQTIRKSLSDDKLSHTLIAIGLKVLRKISINEKDFITMATEVITDIRDSYDNEEDTFHSAISGFDDDEEDDENNENGSEGDSREPQKRRRIEPKLPPDEIVVRALITTQHVLELIEEPLDNHLSLKSIYSGLVNFAIVRNDKFTVHLQGLKCLGLFAIIDKSTAMDAVTTIFASIRHAGEETKIVGMKAIVDILSTYGTSIMDSRALYLYGKLFYKSLNSYEMPKLQCVVAEGLCKLFLAEVFGRSSSEDKSSDNTEFETEKQLFEALILVYFHPSTANNQELKQILSFCIPVYAFSHPNHQFRLASISGDVVYRMFSEDSDLSSSEKALTPLTVVQQLIYWCDPNKLVNLKPGQLETQTPHVWQCVYFLQVVEQDTVKAVKKAIINNFSKFYITDTMNPQVIQGLVDGLLGTKECFERNKDDPEFAFDKLTIKNFDSFEAHLHDINEKIKQKAEEIEKRLRSTSRSQSRASSVAAEDRTSEKTPPTVTKAEEDDKIPDATDAEEVIPMDVDNVEKNDVDMELSKEVNEKEHEEQEEAKRQNEINAELQDIDKMLEDEDGVDYDISITD